MVTVIIVIVETAFDSYTGGWITFLIFNREIKMQFLRAIFNLRKLHTTANFSCLIMTFLF